MAGAVTYVEDMRRALAPRRGEQATTWGEVTVASPLQVRFAGDTEAARVELKDAGYAPVAGDKVLLIRVGGQWLALGRIGPA